MKRNESYAKALESLGSAFSAEYGIYISRKFDPRKWLRSFRLDSRLDGYWPRKVDENISLPVFRIGVKSEEHDCWYATGLEYGKLANGTIAPVKFMHTCTDNLYSNTACKHAYRALAEADNHPKAGSITTFYPDYNLLYEFESIEATKAKAAEKLARTYEAMEEFLRLNEKNSLTRLNARIDYLGNK